MTDLRDTDWDLRDASPPALRAPGGMPAPPGDLDRTIAHLLVTAIANTVHLDRHTAAAQAATTPDSLAHNLRHARNHAAVTSEHQVKLRAALTRRMPAVGTELEQLDSQISAGLRKSAADASRGLAHDLSSATVAIGHVDRHLAEAQGTSDPASVKFNLEHAATHVKEIQHYHGELRDGLAAQLPAAAAEIGKLGQVLGLDGTSIPMTPGYPARSLPDDDDYDAPGEARGGPEPA